MHWRRGQSQKAKGRAESLCPCAIGLLLRRGLRREPEDRLSLGVSDSGAFLASLGGAYVTEGFDLYAEVSSRIYTEGSVIGSSPLRLGAGARVWAVPEVLFIGVGADVRLTPQSAALVDTGTNAPIEPVLGVQLSLGVRIGAETPRVEQVVEDPSTDETTEEQVIEAPAETVGTAAGRVTSSDAPVAGAQVQVTSDVDGQTRTVVSDAEGRWEIQQLPIGGARYRVSADGLEPMEGTLTIAAGAPVETPTALARRLPQGEIRGVIQGSNGQPLSARIVIRPLGRELTADVEGSFAVEVAPGEYDVEVSAPGHRAQTRHVTVSEQGVVVLNVQLRAGR